MEAREIGDLDSSNQRVLTMRIAAGFRQFSGTCLLVGSALTCLLALGGLARAEVSLTLAWDTSNDTNTIGYKLHCLAGANHAGVFDTGTNQHFALENLEPAVTYRFHVTAYDAWAFDSDSSEPVLWTAPTILATLRGDAHVRLTWLGASAALGYRVKRAESSGGPYQVLATNLTTTWVDEAVANGQTYYYLVSILTPQGESRDSNEAPGGAEAGPGNLSAQQGASGVELFWTGLAEAASYGVKRAETRGGPYLTIATEVTQTNYLDPNVASGRAYYYVVVAQRPAGDQSGHSSEATVVLPPGPPRDLDASLLSAQAIRLSWTLADPVVDAFLVEWTQDGSSFTPLNPLPGHTRAYVVVDVAPLAQFHFRVRAINSAGESEFSNLSAVSTPAFGLNVNFAPPSFGTDIAGYVNDYGEAFGLRTNGLTYGWNTNDVSAGVHYASAYSPDTRYDTFIPFRPDDSSSTGRLWEVALPNGFYSVHLVAGDPSGYDSAAQFVVEGDLTPLRFSPDSPWSHFTNTVRVEDGRITIHSSPSPFRNKLCFVDIYPTIPIPPELSASPISQTLTQNSAFSLSVQVAAGSEPLHFHWHRNGLPIPDSDAPDWTVPFAQRADGGDYFVVVSNLVGMVTSEVVRVTIIPTDHPPTFSPLAPHTIPEDVQVGINLQIEDPDSPASTVLVTARSADQQLLPDGNLSITNGNGRHTLILVSGRDQSGTTTVTVTAVDLDGHAVTNSFQLEITPVNDPPTLDPLSSFAVLPGAGPQTVALTGITSGGNEPEDVILTAHCDPPDLLSELTVVREPFSAIGTLTLTPAPDALGYAIVTVTADDGQANQRLFQRRFTLNVSTNPLSSIYIEAESGDLSAPMRSRPHPKAVNGWYVSSTTANQGLASYQVELPSAGDWLIWCRVLSEDTGADSFFVAADDGAEGIYDTIRNDAGNAGNTWQWTLVNARPVFEPRTFTLGSGIHTLRFRAREPNALLDALILTTNRSFIPTVGSSNNPPTLNPISDLTILEDAGLQVIVLAGISPGHLDEGQPVSLSVFSSNPALLPTLELIHESPDSTGILLLNPAPDAHGQAQIYVTAYDGGVTDHDLRREFTVSVLPANDVPRLISLPGSLSLLQGQSASIPIGVADPDSTQVVLAALASNPSLLPAAGLVLEWHGSNYVLHISPDPNQSGTTALIVQARDEQGASTSAEILVTVVPMNQAPVLSALADATVEEDGRITLPFTIQDPQTPQGPWTLMAGADNALLLPPSAMQLAGTGSNGTITLVPQPNQHGAANVTLSVVDGQGASSSRTFRLSVTPVDDPPSITPLPDLAIDEDSGTGPLTFVVSDLETPDSLLEVTAGSSNPSLIANTGLSLAGKGAQRTLTITPQPDQSGTATVTLNLTDGSQQSASTHVLITVRAINDPPAFAPLPALILDANAGPVVVNLSSIAAGGGETQALTLSAASSNPSLIPNPTILYTSPSSTGSLVLHPVPGATGQASIRVTLDDGQSQNRSSAQEFLITVRPVNTAPSLPAIPNQQTAEDTLLTLPLVIGDAEPTLVALTADSDQPQLIGSTDIFCSGIGSNRVVTLAPRSNQVGTARITLSASDGVTNSTTAFLLTVLPVNDEPTLNPILDFLTNAAGGNIAYTIPLSGVTAGAFNEAQSLSVTATSSNLTLLPNPTVTYSSPNTTGSLTLRPSNHKTGTSRVTVTVTDNGSPSQAFTRTFLVNLQSSANALPSLSSITDLTIDEDASTGPLPFTVSDAETPAGSLTVTASSTNQTLLPDANIVLAGSGTSRTLTLSPVANLSGTTAVTLTVNDASFGRRSTTFRLTVNPVDDAPSISSIPSQTLAEDTTSPVLGFSVGDLETPASSLILTASSSDPFLIPASNLTLSGNAAERALRFSPAANHFGTATISVMVTDGTLVSRTDFLVTVTPVNDSPWISNLLDQTINEDAVPVPIAFQVSDLETPGLVVTAVSSNPDLLPASSLQLSGAGSARLLTLWPAADRHGTATVTVTASDGTAATSSSFLVRVLPVNDPPTLEPIPDLHLPANAPPQTILLAGLSSGSPNEDQPLFIVSTSSDPNLIPHPAIQWTRPNEAASLLLMPQPGASGSATITVTLNDGQPENNLVTRAFSVSVESLPNITPVPPQTTPEDQPLGPIEIAISSPDSSPSALTLRAFSSDAGIVDNSGLVLSGTGGNRGLRVTPVPNAVGQVWVTLEVADPAGHTTQSAFLLTVQPVDDAPTLDPIGDVVILAGAAATVSLTGIGAGAANEIQGLFLRATSSDASVLPHPAISYASPSSTATLTLAPAVGAAGTAIVTVTVLDDGLTIGGVDRTSREFLVTVNPHALVPQLRLTIQSGAGLLSWPIDFTSDFRLFSTPDLNTPWTPLTTAPVGIGGYYLVPISLDEPTRLYRLCEGCGN